MYHRDGEICDHATEVGLHILNERSVESKQPQSSRSDESSNNQAPISKQESIIKLQCPKFGLLRFGVYLEIGNWLLVIIRMPLHLDFVISFLDGFALVKGFLSFANSKLQLHELSLSVQSNGYQCQAQNAGFPYQGADFPSFEEEFP